MTNENGNGWRFGWGAIGTLVALALLLTSGISFFAGGVSSAAVMENRVTNLERRQAEILTSLSETNRRLNDLVDVLWQQRQDRIDERRRP